MKKIIIILLIALLVFCGCDSGYSRISAGASGFDHEMYVIQNGVPYTGGLDLRLDSIKLLETDTYGRKLFYYRTTLSHLGILFVVQNVAEPVAYYYENDFYILRQDATKVEHFSEKDKLLIKERNDWNKPLKPEKMYSVICSEPADYENVSLPMRKMVTEEVPTFFAHKDWSSTQIRLNGLETYLGIGQIALLTVYSDKEESEHYIILLDSTCSPVIRAMSPAGSVNEFRESVISFKDTYCKSNSIPVVP